MATRKIIIILAVPVFFSSCISKNKEKVIASFNEENLFLSDAISEMPEHTNDSTYFISSFIDDWLKKKIMISHAEMNLSTDLLKYEKQIEEYRGSLLIYAYQQELLKQNLDSTIKSSEIKNYYEKYSKQFKLAKSILKGRLIIIEKSAPNLSSLEKWYKSDKESIIENLEDYCQQFAKEYYLDEKKWQYFSFFNNKLPNLIEEEEYFLKNTRSVFFEDETFRYYIFIKAYKTRGSISPLEIEREKIKNVLINKKKVQYLETLENKLYEDALAKKKITLY